jgi:glutathione S-transferase
VAIKLYVVHGSHPCAAVERAFAMKDLAFDVVELPVALHAAIQRVRFGVRSVPAVRWESGEKLSGSRAIMRRLEELAPQPALFPADHDAREDVERAEEWGDQVWQPMARRLLWHGFARAPRAMSSYQQGSRLPRVPMPLLLALALVVTRVEARLTDAGEPNVRADLHSLPGHLDRIDGWLHDGVLGTDVPHAADLQIAATSRLMLTIGDVRPFFAGRPAEEHARRLFADWAGTTPEGAFPAEWLDRRGTSAQAAA